MMAHTLGNPFDLTAVVDFCRRHDLWLTEDNCDALGSTYDGQLTGTFGDLFTQSFDLPHRLPVGEGEVVSIVRTVGLKLLVESFREWRRECWCASGFDNPSNKGFGWQLGDLPEGLDHEYIGPSGFFVGESMWENASSPRRLFLCSTPLSTNRFLAFQPLGGWPM